MGIRADETRAVTSSRIGLPWARLIGTLAASAVVLGAPACAKQQPVTTPKMSNGVSCPSLALDISASEGDTSGSLVVSASASSSLTTSATTYSWSASAGTFADPRARSTVYACPPSTAPQTQMIHVSASNGPCTVSQQSVVVCLNIVDIRTGAGGAPYVYTGFGGTVTGAGGAGGGPGGDAGSGAGGADAGDASIAVDGSCGPDPTTDDGDGCNQCTLANCTTLESVQSNPNPAPRKPVPVPAGCHHLASDAQRQACEALYCCIRANHCVINGDPTSCWCGKADPVNCSTGAEIAAGPCVREIQAAAGSDQAPQIALRMIDPSYPLGGAINLATCRATFCADPSAPVCGGY